MAKTVVVLNPPPLARRHDPHAALARQRGFFLDVAAELGHQAFRQEAVHLVVLQRRDPGLVDAQQAAGPSRRHRNCGDRQGTRRARGVPGQPQAAGPLPQLMARQGGTVGLSNLDSGDSNTISGWQGRPEQAWSKIVCCPRIWDLKTVCCPRISGFRPLSQQGHVSSTAAIPMGS